MSKYHVDKKGRIQECKALFRSCNLGGDHVEASSLEEAQKEFEKKFAAENSILANFTKKQQIEYNKLDELNKEFTEAYNEADNPDMDSDTICRDLESVHDEYMKKYMIEFNATEKEAKDFFYDIQAWIENKEEQSEVHIKFALEQNIKNIKYIQDELKELEMFEKILKNTT